MATIVKTAEKPETVTYYINGDSVSITVNVGAHKVEETRLNGEKEETITVWEYTTNSFYRKVGEIDIDDVTANPEKYVNYKSHNPMKEKVCIDLIQEWLDAQAQAAGYDNIFTVCTYVNSSVERYAKEGAYFLALRDKVWSTAFDLFQKMLNREGEEPDFPIQVLNLVLETVQKENA